MKELSVILPVLNEEQIITPVIADIKKVLDQEKIDYELVLVDNGSQDGSSKVISDLASADKRLVVVHTPLKGWGRAIIIGWKKANGKYVAHMPSDGQVNPVSLVELLALLWQQNADIAKIKRVTRESLLRSVNSKIYNLIANLLFNIKVTDTNGCPKMFARVLVKKFDIQSLDSFLDLELLVKARFLRLRIVEIETKGLPRTGGVSNTSMLTVLEFLNNMIKFLFSSYLKSWKNSVNG